jgi:acetyl-CoA acetyltransferase
VSEDVWIIGTSMTPFGKLRDRDVLDLATTAAFGALDDAGVTMRDVQVMAVGSQFEAITFGQQVQKQIGQTGIPLYNVHNACATGATALRSVLMEIKAGEADMGIAVGAEQMTNPGTPATFPRYDGETYTPKGRNQAIMHTEGVLGTGQMFGVFSEIGVDYARKHDGVGFEQFAKVAEKNHAHAELNPLAQRRQRHTLDEIMNAEMLSYPNTLYMACPIGDGAAAVIVVSDSRLKTMDPDVRRRAVKISASVMTTDPYTPDTEALPDVNTLTRNAASKAYDIAGIGPDDLDLVELHDCFATAELVHYDNLRLCEPGGAGEFIDSGAPWRDGSMPVNVSGGLLSKGHPIGATGVANVYVTQLRGEAGDRQLDNPQVGMTHVIGLGSACCINILERGSQPSS